MLLGDSAINPAAAKEELNNNVLTQPIPIASDEEGEEESEEGEEETDHIGPPHLPPPEGYQGQRLRRPHSGRPPVGR